MRASAVVKRQWTPIACSLRASSQAPTSQTNVLACADAPVQTLSGQDTEGFNLPATLSQLPCLGAC